MGSRLACFALLIVLCATTGYYFYANRPTISEPPIVDTSTLDRYLTEKIQTRHQKVVSAPRNAAYWGEYGMVLLANDLPKPALECFATAEKLDPTNVRWTYLQGYQLAQETSPDAIDKLKNALQKIPPQESKHVAVVLLNLAELATKLGDPEQGLIYLQALPTPNPFPERKAYVQALIQFHKKKYQEVLDELPKLLNNPFAAKSACLLLIRAAQAAEEKALVDKYEKLNKTLPQLEWEDPFLEEVATFREGIKARLNRMVLLERTGELISAKELGEQLVQDYPREDVLLTYGTLLARNRDFRRASDLLKKAHDLNPQNKEVLFQLGLLNFVQGRSAYEEGKLDLAYSFLNESINWLEKLTKEKNDQAPALGTLALALGYSGKRSRGLAVVQDARKTFPDRYDLPLVEAELWMLEKDAEKMRGALLQAEKIAPGNREVQQVKGQLEYRLANPPRKK